METTVKLGFSTAGTLHKSDWTHKGNAMQMCGTSTNQKYSLVILDAPLSEEDFARVAKCKKCFG